jgi:hypothetical protein
MALDHFNAADAAIRGTNRFRNIRRDLVRAIARLNVEINRLEGVRVTHGRYATNQGAVLNTKLTNIIAFINNPGVPPTHSAARIPWEDRLERYRRARDALTRLLMDLVSSVTELNNMALHIGVVINPNSALGAVYIQVNGLPAAGGAAAIPGLAQDRDLVNAENLANSQLGTTINRPINAGNSTIQRPGTNIPITRPQAIQENITQQADRVQAHLAQVEGEIQTILSQIEAQLQRVRGEIDQVVQAANALP